MDEISNSTLKPSIGEVPLPGAAMMESTAVVDKPISAVPEKTMGERFGECVPSILWLILLIALGFGLTSGHFPWADGNRIIYLMMIAGIFGAGGATVRILYAVLRSQEKVAAKIGTSPDSSNQNSSAVAQSQAYVQPIMMPLVGAFLAMVFELVASADLGLTIPQNGHAVAAWGSIIGLFFPQAMDKLKSVADALLGSGTPAPVIPKNPAEPAKVLSAKSAS